MGLDGRRVEVGERYVPSNIYAPNASAGAPAAATVASSNTGVATAPQVGMAPTSSSGISQNNYKEQTIDDMPGTGSAWTNIDTAESQGSLNRLANIGLGMMPVLGQAIGAYNTGSNFLGGTSAAGVLGNITGNNSLKDPLTASQKQDVFQNAQLTPGASDPTDKFTWAADAGKDATITQANTAAPTLGANASTSFLAPAAPYTGPKAAEEGSSSSGTYGGLNTGSGSGFNSANWGGSSSSSSGGYGTNASYASSGNSNYSPYGGSGYSSDSSDSSSDSSDSSSDSSYAEGGMVGLQTGVPAPQGAPQQGPRPDMQGDAAHGMIARAGADPKIKQLVQQAVQSGKLDPQQLHMAGQLAQACIQNPALWPQLRQFAVQKGLCGPNDLPAQYDQRLVMSILAAAKAAEGMLESQGQETQQGIEPPPGMGQGSGGLLHGPGTGTSDSIPAKNLADGGQVNVSDGEYVIPAKIVRAKGKDFFDSLIRKYSDVPS